MNRDEHLCQIAQEECMEIAQRLSKLQRFGPDEIQPDPVANPDRLTNRQRVLMEYIDLVSVMEMLGFRPIGEQQKELLLPKRRKVEKFLVYSASCGTLTP